jgi:tetratricopeptide (TPR) repeat protein
LLYERDDARAEQEFLHAINLNPKYIQARAWYGLFCLHWVGGREREGREEMARLLQLDPLSAYANVLVSFSDFTCSRMSEAVDHARRGIELDPGSYLGYWSLMQSLHGSARYEEAAAVGERALEMSGRHAWALSSLVTIYADWGKPDHALAVYGELVARSARQYVQPSMLTPAAAAVGDMDGAIVIAQQALDERDPLFVLLARRFPGYRLLRTDPRFLAIVSQLNLPGWSGT